jgi:EAL domain-containing protein (putative c-di-GMP-specific phosphodiesterase class I)/CheY-like chemotaxis protein
MAFDDSKTRLATPAFHTGGRVLVVEPDEASRRLVVEMLEGCGLDLAEAGRGDEAVDELQRGGTDAVLACIQLPDISGLDLLRQARERDGDLPVVLMTGDPALESAIRAVELGATNYLIKPLDLEVLGQVIRRAVRLGQLARAKREALSLLGAPLRPSERMAMEAALGRALNTLWPAFQPIVSWPDGRVVAYEALLRTGEPTYRSPPDVISAAERIGRVHDVGRRMRKRVAEAAATLPAGPMLFVNLDPRDLMDDELASSDAPLTAFADRVVLEITERASLHGLVGVHDRVRRLRSLGFRIAVDDLGAGYSGLSSLVQMEPEFVKIDVSLVRGIDIDGARQHVVRSLHELCSDMGMGVVCEGVESAAERDTLADIGCVLLQGYWFARPGPAWPTVRKG